MTDVAGIRPRMSVVIPHYNHVDLLPEALDAIARQTMPPFEVVVVDDGSTDESVARLESLATKIALASHLPPPWKPRRQRRVQYRSRLREWRFRPVFCG
jgi:glycosyltransferase involved in cell wall biosynthesis